MFILAKVYNYEPMGTGFKKSYAVSLTVYSKCFYFFILIS